MNKFIGPIKGPQQTDGPRINEAIRAPKIRLINEKGQMIDEISVREALEIASHAGLDLVEVSPHSSPPVCKILDYGKLRFEEQKKKNAERKKQKIIEVKEVKVRPVIEEHDYQTKLRNAKRFIDDGDKVKVTMRFKGREMAHQDIGMKVLRRIIEDMGEDIKIELHPRLEGRQMIMILIPKV